MHCPRCDQENSVESRTPSWICVACNIAFTESTQVIRPLTKDSIWVEKGTGTRVRILELDGDPFDLTTAVKYQTDSYDECSRVMLANDFRFYFKSVRHKAATTRTPIVCRPKEEWESVAGIVYVVLQVNETEQTVHVVPVDSSQSFWIKSDDFDRQFKRLERRSDYARLLGD
jgi:hypothetical protein